MAKNFQINGHNNILLHMNMALRKGDVCFSVLLLTLVFLSIALIIWSDPVYYFNLSGDIEIPNKGIFISTIIVFHTPVNI